ncbi:hypothetical protein PUN28_007301 [Cardiocondyla obscurior]|uniref:Uncharacterized protein n=1 Tax=Cardiocondyla obscurior TaxID=286306 RepID=A0AAW2G670_9HYME
MDSYPVLQIVRCRLGTEMEMDNHGYPFPMAAHSHSHLPHPANHAHFPRSHYPHPCVECAYASTLMLPISHHSSRKTVNSPRRRKGRVSLKGSIRLFSSLRISTPDSLSGYKIYRFSSQRFLWFLLQAYLLPRANVNF